MKLQYYCLSDTGRVRKENQDFCGVSQDESLFIVADGMGGADGGEIASQTAVNSFLDFFHNSNLDLNDEVIKTSFYEAHQKLSEKAEKYPTLFGMGTTIVITQLINSQAILSHVGDSRIYLYRNNKLELLTKDHSLRQEHLDEKRISDEEFEAHPLKNIITRFIGPAKFFEPDIKKINLKESDIILLCSDGLSNEVTDQKIEDIITQNTSDIEKISKKLIQTANNNGGCDNSTLIIIQINNLD